MKCHWVVAVAAVVAGQAADAAEPWNEHQPTLRKRAPRRSDVGAHESRQDSTFFGPDKISLTRRVEPALGLEA